MRKAAPALSALLLAACAAPVYSPGVLVLPGSKKTFDQFRFDEQQCRSYAQAQLNDSGAEWTQQRYDRAFLQCMYANGHKVPVSGRYFDSEPQAAVPTPPPPPSQAQPPTPVPPPPPPPPKG